MEVAENGQSVPLGQDFVVLRDAMNQLLEELVPSRGSRSSGANGTMVRPLPDVYATQDEAVIIAAVPGMSPQDLEVTINQNVVTLQERCRPRRRVSRKGRDLVPARAVARAVPAQCDAAVRGRCGQGRRFV